MQQIFFPSLWNSLSSILAANHPSVRAATIGPWALTPFHECDQPHQRFCHAYHRTALHVWEKRWFVFWSCEACAAQQNETDRCRAHFGPTGQTFGERNATFTQKRILMSALSDCSKVIFSKHEQGISIELKTLKS